MSRIGELSDRQRAPDKTLAEMRTGKPVDLTPGEDREAAGGFGAWEMQTGRALGYGDVVGADGVVRRVTCVVRRTT